MKNLKWQFCLVLLLTPFFLAAQDASGGAIDTVDSVNASLLTTSPFVNFQTFTKENKKITIQWEVRFDTADYFTVERSADGKTYEAIGILKASDSNVKYEFSDEFPSRGQAFYRVRFTSKSGKDIYSEPVTILLPGSSFFRLYPNPADNILIVRVESPFEVQIVDAFGKPRITKSLAAGPQVLDVSFLEKGVYVIRVTDKNTGRLQFDKFYKN